MKRCIFIIFLIAAITYPCLSIEGADMPSGEALVFMMEGIYRTEHIKTSDFYELTDVEYIYSDGQYNYYSCDAYFDHLLYSIDDVISDMYETGIYETIEKDIEFYDEGYSDMFDSLLNPGFANQWYLDTIQAKKAWDYVGKEPGKGVVVAVIDSGIHYKHKDLQGNIWRYNELANIENINDTDGHGTHVSGIIGMIADNYRGGAGVAYSAEIMPVKAGESNDGTFLVSDVIAALNYAVKNDADIINMSFGSPHQSELFKAALENASKKCVLVAAAGNEGKLTEDTNAENADNIYPAAYPFVLGVMASDRDNSILSWSNFDTERFTENEYEIAAPGNEIYSTYLSGTYKYMNGTSMAAPMVSGAAAILYQYARDKGIENIAEYVFLQLSNSSYPILNIYEALTAEPEVNVVVNDFEEVYEDNIISCGFDIRNTWKEAADVTVKISVAKEAAEDLELLSSEEISVGKMSAGEVYSIDAQGESPVRIYMPMEQGKPYVVPVKYSVTADNKVFEYSHNININVSKAEASEYTNNMPSTTVDTPAADTDITAGNEYVVNPQRVKGVKVKRASKSGRKIKNKIKWKKSENAQRYIVYYAKARYGKYKKLAVVRKTSYIHKITKKKNNKRFYKVRAVYVHNEEDIYGPYSKIVKK